MDQHRVARRRRRRPVAVMGTASAIVLVAAGMAAAATAVSGAQAGRTARLGPRDAASSTLTVEASPTGPIARNFNPFLTTSPAVLLGASGMVYEPLLMYNMAKPGQMQPWLATSTSFSDGDRILTIDLRKGVKFSNGRPFTSRDVVFTFDMLKANSTLNTLGITFSSISAPTPYEVVMHFATSGFVQLYNIAGDTPIVEAQQWQSVKNPTSFADPDPIGTGPYVLQSMNPQGITLVKNQHYWQPNEPKVTKLVYEVFDSNTSANTALEGGQLDWAGNFLPHIEQLFKAKDPAHRFYSFVPDRMAYLALNLTKYPFDLLPVRKALSLALDRTAVIDAGEFGEEPAAQSPTGLILPAESNLLAPAYKHLTYKTNVKEALSLLKGAGFHKSSSGRLMEPNGQPFAFSIIGPSPYTDVMADDEVVAQQWDKLGAEVTVQGESVGTWIGQIDTGNYDVSLTEGGSIQLVDVYADYNEILNSSFSQPVGKTSVGDVEHFESPTADALLAKWVNATTGQARQTALDGIESVMVGQVPVIPLFYHVFFNEWTTNTFEGWPTAHNDYQVPWPAGTLAEDVVLHLYPVKG